MPVHNMRLIRIHVPVVGKIEVLLLQLIPCVALYHELPCYLVPSLLPIYSRVTYQNGHIIDSRVHSYQTEPTRFHAS
jgi:hypothetical protein